MEEAKKDQEMPPWVEREVLTTGQVARICRVSRRTVTMWLEKGILEGYRIPGSQDRRIYADSLYRMMKSTGMRIPAKIARFERRMALVCLDPALVDLIKYSFPVSRGYKIFCLDDAIEAAYQLAIHMPRVVIVSSAIGRETMLRLLECFHFNIFVRHVIWIGLVGDDDSDHKDLLSCGYKSVFRYPSEISQLFSFVREVTT